MDPALLGRLAGACVVIALVLALVRLIALRIGGPVAAGSVGRARLITLLETTCLPGAAALHLVRIGQRYVVLGRTPSSLVTLAELSAEEIARGSSAPRDVDRPSPLAPLLRVAERLRRAP